MVQWLTNPTRSREAAGSIPSLSQWVKDPVVPVPDPALLWLWRRPAATVPIRPLAWEPPYAGMRPQKGKKTKKKECIYMYDWVAVETDSVNHLHAN